MWPTAAMTKSKCADSYTCLLESGHLVWNKACLIPGSAISVLMCIMVRSHRTLTQRFWRTNSQRQGRGGLLEGVRENKAEAKVAFSDARRWHISVALVHTIAWAVHWYERQLWRSKLVKLPGLSSKTIDLSLLIIVIQWRKKNYKYRIIFAVLKCMYSL